MSSQSFEVAKLEKSKKQVTKDRQRKVKGITKEKYETEDKPENHVEQGKNRGSTRGLTGEQAQETRQA